jgi:hypothetical protein
LEMAMAIVKVLETADINAMLGALSLGRDG